MFLYVPYGYVLRVMSDLFVCFIHVCHACFCLCMFALFVLLRPLVCDSFVLIFVKNTCFVYRSLSAVFS